MSRCLYQYNKLYTVISNVCRIQEYGKGHYHASATRLARGIFQIKSAKYLVEHQVRWRIKQFQLSTILVDLHNSLIWKGGYLKGTNSTYMVASSKQTLNYRTLDDKRWPNQQSPTYGNNLEITSPIYSHALHYEDQWTEQSMAIHRAQNNCINSRR